MLAERAEGMWFRIHRLTLAVWCVTGELHHSPVAVMCFLSSASRIVPVRAQGVIDNPVRHDQYGNDILHSRRGFVRRISARPRTCATEGTDFPPPASHSRRNAVTHHIGGSFTGISSAERTGRNYCFMQFINNGAGRDPRTFEVDAVRKQRTGYRK